TRIERVLRNDSQRAVPECVLPSTFARLPEPITRQDIHPLSRTIVRRSASFPETWALQCLRKRIVRKSLAFQQSSDRHRSGARQKPNDHTYFWCHCSRTFERSRYLGASAADLDII